MKSSGNGSMLYPLSKKPNSGIGQTIYLGSGSLNIKDGKI